MPTLVLDPTFAGLDEILERRRRLGQDRHDEVWDGVLHVSPDPAGPHADVQAQIITILRPLAIQVGLWTTVGSNFGTGPKNYRVPDGALHRQRPLDTYMLNVALVLEIVSPYDESWKKLPFYGSCGVDDARSSTPSAARSTGLPYTATARTHQSPAAP